MAKTNVPAAVRIGTTKFKTNAKPDAYDLRDLEYRAMLRPLPPVLDARPKGGEFQVLKQSGESCTGHALAAVVNTVLARQAAELKLPTPGLVSPYMLYKLARRYDEFLGEKDEGSSLRGAFKGWLRHGIALESQWSRLADVEGVSEVDASPDLDNPAFIASCRQRPLGAYYRVNAYRLDDMQSAIYELHAIAVSAAVHSGWENPVRVTGPDGHPLTIIKRDHPAEQIGGHAFCIVGYNEIGFLVQNSWGTDWGDGGFATLLYDDWLASAYDAWVCRPGVPSTPLATPSVASRVTTAGDIVLSGGPNLTLLRRYVVNTGNDGRLSTTGKFASTPGQLDEIFTNMAEKHAAWEAVDGPKARNVVLYAHGGMIDEFNGLGIAQHQLGWWLSNHVYPINFCWESGALETISDAISDLVDKHLPFGGIRFDFEEQGDRLVEFFARKFAGGLWQQMKENAIAASATESQSDVRGGTEIARRLQDYRAAHPNLRIHLAGHSAGSIFLCALVERLTEMGQDVDSLAYMGGAATNQQFVDAVLPAFNSRAGKGSVRRFTTFDLSEKMEQDDTCPLGDKVFYHKSLLYLVARGLEPHPDPRTGMVPLVGLQLGLDGTIPSGETLRQAIESTTDTCDGRIVIAPTPSETDLRSDARGHGDFDNDAATMTSILLRILEVSTPPAGPYRPDVEVPDLPQAAPLVAQDGMDTHVLAATTAPKAPVAPVQPAAATATDEAFAAGAPKPAGLEEAPAAAAESVAAAAGAAAVLALPEIKIPSEAALTAVSNSPAFDVLKANGYTWEEHSGPDPADGNGRAGNGKHGRRRRDA